MDRTLRRLAEARPFNLPPRGRRRLRAGHLLLLPATAMAAVIAVLLVVNGQGPQPVPHVDQAPQERIHAKDARELLLAAAQRAESGEQQATGRYWLRKTISSLVYEIDGYYIQGRTEDQHWLAMSTQDNYVHCSKWLGSQPVTDADRAAWQHAGSPTSMLAKKGKVAGQTLTIGPGEMSCREHPTEDDSGFTILGEYFTLEQLRALPTDPAQLREKLLRIDPDAQLLYYATTDIVLRAPTTPGTRAAAYRMLADQPGITLVENVTDRLGRPGSAVDATLGTGPNAFHVRLILDLATGAALGDEFYHASHPEHVVSNAVLESALTDQTPPRP